MTPRSGALLALYAGAWTVVGWLLSEPGRLSEAQIRAVTASGSYEEVRAATDRLSAIYADSPRQAWGDWAAFPTHRTTIAVAASTVPGARSLVEEALVTLPPRERFFVALNAATGGKPTFVEGQWTGTDPLSVPPGLMAFLRGRLDRETSPELIVLYDEILRGSGWNPPPDELFARARDTGIPADNRTGSLLILARQPGGAEAVRRALDAAAIPDAIASRILVSRVLDADPATEAWLVRFALDPSHAVVAGGAFDVLYEQLGTHKDRLWAVVSAVDPGSRLPLMRALLLRGRWPVACRRWFAGVWPEEVRRGGAEFERELAATGLSNLGGWILEERDEDLKRDLSRIHARLSAHGSR